MIPGNLGLAALWLAGVLVVLAVVFTALGGLAHELAPLGALR